MEIIPQHVYTYDGVPAYKSGEWPGSKPSHFNGSKLILKPIEHPEKEFIICHSKHFPQKYSEEFVFEKGIKSVPPFIHEDIYKPKKRRLKPIITEPIIRHRDRSFRPKDQFYSTNIAPFLQTKTRVKPNIPELTEYGVESVMNRKKRVYSLEEKRNYMKNCKPGDKNYNCVENSPEYFRMEGLIVGSTNRLNLNKTTRKGEDNFYKTLDLNIKVLNRNKIWGSKVLLDSLNYDKEYVEKLNSWESKVFEKTEKKVDNKGKKK
jgi:hypothetical protein